MSLSTAEFALDIFRAAARSVPAYRALLSEHGIAADDIQTTDDFLRLPVLDKQNTFQRFAVAELCWEGAFGKPASVLTSSGHSGIFAFGLTDEQELEATTQAIDDALDQIFGVRSSPTLLINCLPMGVKVPTRACTLAETSVRPDMVVALVKALASEFFQIVLVGDAAFVKFALELGSHAGIDWRPLKVHVVLGEEMLAENARTYLHSILGSRPANPETGLVISSMGIAEIGLNLFFEAPPVAPLVLLRRALHHHADLRQAIFGEATWVPSLFTFDPRRVHVEFVNGDQLALTTLMPTQIPLVRYAPGDRGSFVRIPERIRPRLTELGCALDLLAELPIVAIRGRGPSVLAGETIISAEAIKEGIYRDPELARLVTANFRVAAEQDRRLVRLQLGPATHPSADLERRFGEAIAEYAEGPVRVKCESYADFCDGVCLDYERKFDYFGSRQSRSARQ